MENLYPTLSPLTKRRMRALANYIEQAGRVVKMYCVTEGAKRPDLAKHANECGSVACCGGWAVLKNFRAYKKWIADGSWSPLDFAAEWLGIPHDIEVRSALFVPSGWGVTSKANMVDPRTQKRRLLQVLRGERPLNDDWLIGKR